jgi:magnesium-transporting ATPase (P-type)
VGIGISGNEGMQAVRASDYAIAQFRFLENLLLQHGRMNYRRIAIVILYSFYKNCVLVTMLFWFNFFNGFSGSALLNGNVQAMYNVIFTSFPIMVYGVLERDVEFKSCSRFPVLYGYGQKKQGFNLRQMVVWMLLGVIHSLALMFISAHVSLGRIFSSDGINTVDRFAFGNEVGNYLVIVVNLKLILETSYFTSATATVYGLTLFSYIVIVMILNLFPPSIFDVSGTGSYSFGVAKYWLMCALIGPLALIIDVAYLFSQKLFMPNESDQVKVHNHAHLHHSPESPLLQPPPTLSHNACRKFNCRNHGNLHRIISRLSRLLGRPRIHQRLPSGSYQGARLVFSVRNMRAAAPRSRCRLPVFNRACSLSPFPSAYIVTIVVRSGQGRARCL